MKTPFLILTALTLTLHCGFARAETEEQRDAKEREARKQRIEHAWDKIEDAGADLRDGIEMAVDDFVGGTRDVIHERPEIQGLPHLMVLRKGKEAKIVSCRSLIGQVFRNRDKHPSHNRCDVALTKGSFSLEELQACASRHGEQGGAAFNLQRELARIMRRDEDYTYNLIGKWGSNDEYKDLFRQCARERKPAAKPKAKPLPEPQHVDPPRDGGAEAPKLEFKPVEPADPQAPKELNGTIE